MGCDIHCYIEYKRGDYWKSFGGRISPGRNYAQFARMAGVRADDHDLVLFTPRGFPNDCGYYASDANHLFISTTKHEKWVTPDRAEEWVKSGYSVYLDETKKFVTNPDHHSHSWLLPSEFESTQPQEAGPEYQAILAALRLFESLGFQARLVFWFDN